MSNEHNIERIVYNLREWDKHTNIAMNYNEWLCILGICIYTISPPHNNACRWVK